MVIYVLFVSTCIILSRRGDYHTEISIERFQKTGTGTNNEESVEQGRRMIVRSIGDRTKDDSEKYRR